jgi:outer membrane receptor protein involved in Fe transport
MVAADSDEYWLDHSDTQAPQAAYYIPETPATGLSAAAAAPYILHGAHNSYADWTPQSDQTLPGVTRPPYQKDSRFYSGVMQLDYSASSALKLTSLTAYNHVNRNDTTNGDGTAYQIYTGQYLGTIGSFSQELRLAGEGQRYNWIVGTYYSNDKVAENQIIYIGDFSTATPLRGPATSLNDPRYTAAQTEAGFQATNQLGDFDNNSISGFANGQYQLTDTLKATGGVRLTSDRSHFDGCAADFNGNSVPVWNTAVALIAGQYPAYNAQPGQCLTFATPGPGPSGLVNGELDQKNVSWRVNLDYKPVEKVLLYGAIARGFKSGAFPIIPANKESQYAPARQEEVTSYEIGSKIELGSARLAVAQYYDQYLNKQVFGAVADPIFTSLARLVSIPKSRIYGSELSLDWRVVAGLTFHSAASYIQTRVLNYTGYNQFGDLLNFAGTEFPDTPHWQLAGNITCDRPLAHGLLVEGVLDGTYQSFSHGDFQNSSTYTIRGTTIPDDIYAIPSFALVNASLSIATSDQRWKGTLWAKNLLGRNYWTSANYGLDMITRFSGMPRTYGASVTWHF